MKQTPMHDVVNEDLLRLIPETARRVVEAGCSSGALGASFREQHPDCEYIGIEKVPEYAALARTRVSNVIVADVEVLQPRDFEAIGPVDCWVFADVLEHLYDPWKLLQALRPSLSAEGCVVACIPNAQHWSVQVRLNTGDFNYEAIGLLDRTHIRWFTRKTIVELFHSSGYEIERITDRVFEEGEQRERAMPSIRALAEQFGEHPDVAEQDAMPLQYLVVARAAAD